MIHLNTEITIIRHGLSTKAVPDQVQKVPQPLWDMMGLDTRTELLEYLSGKGEYTSVNSLK